LLRRNILEEEFMSCDEMERVIRLHKKAEEHSKEYGRLFGDDSAQSKALWHLQKAERLYSQVSGLIRDLART
jgi:hypothetical protein